MQLTDFITQTAAYQELAQGLRPASRQLVTGIAGSARTLLIKSLLADQALAQSIVFVTDTMFHADQLVDDLSNVLDNNQLYEFPVEELLAAEVATSSPDFFWLNGFKH